MLSCQGQPVNALPSLKDSKVAWVMVAHMPTSKSQDDQHPMSPHSCMRTGACGKQTCGHKLPRLPSQEDTLPAQRV